MTKGLVRANNFSDLTDKDQAVANLGLSSVDYAALKGLYTTAGIDFAVIGEIGNSQGNYQAQLDGVSSTFSGIVLSGYVNRSGNSAITGNWSHSGIIDIVSGLPSGYPASTDSLFSLSIENGEAVIVASGLIASGLSYNGVRQSSSTVQRALPPSGFSPLHLIPLQVGGQGFFAEAGESPSFHIAPARLGHALDLVTGNLIGSYNSASPAMAVGPDGLLFTPAANAPVIEYDPATRACLGARIWGVVTNVLVRSEEIDNATPWQVSNITVTANTTTAPNGQASAETLSVPAVAPATSFAYQVVACNASTTYTFSFYVRLGTLTASNFRFAIRDDSNGVFIAQDIVPSVTLSTSTWQRVTYTFTTPVGCVLVRPYIYRFASPVAGTFFAWGAQLNTGPLAPYVPTGAVSASSTADVWTITGADFNRIYNQSAVTFYAEAERGVVPDADLSMLLNARNAVSSEIIQIGYLSENVASNYVIVSGVLQSQGYPSGLAGIRRRRIASAFGTNDVAISANGSVPIADATATMPTPDRISIGSFGAAYFLNGYIREGAIFRSRRPNANLQAITL